MLKAIDHVQIAIPVGGEAQARPFYGDLLGLTEVPKPAALAKRGGCWFEGAVRVHLGVEQDFRANVKAHVAFEVDDVAALAAQATAAGFKTQPDDDLDGFERVYIYDPFGNRLEFLAPLKFGLEAEEYAYARRLAYEAVNTPWVTSSDLIRRSTAFLSGGLTDDGAERQLLTELLRLAGHDADHSSEAYTLTGYPPEFALSTYEKIIQYNA